MHIPKADSDIIDFLSAVVPRHLNKFMLGGLPNSREKHNLKIENWFQVLKSVCKNTLQYIRFFNCW